MSLIGRVHPDCVNVANPYHECTESCLRKISEGKGRKTKKKADNGSSYKGGKKSSEDKRASNPYYDEEYHKPRAAHADPRGDRKELDNGSSYKGGKKSSEDKRASNPFYDEQYHKQRAARAEPRGDRKESGSILNVPILGRKTVTSQPKPPQELDVGRGRGVVYHADSPSSSFEETVNVENGSPLDDPIFGRRKPGPQAKPPQEIQNIHDSPSQETEQLENGSVLDDPIFGRRKPGARPKRPEELGNAPGQGVVYPSNSSSSPFKDEVTLGNGDYKPYSSQSAEVKDSSFNKGEIKSLVPPSGIITMSDYLKDPPENGATDMSSQPPIHGNENGNLHQSPGVVSNHTVNNGREGTNDSAFDSRSFSFSGILNGSEDSDEEDARSVNSESSVSVGKYRVKGSFASILQSIFDKYGDIAACCQLESVVMRSYYLDCVCYVVQELRRTSIRQLAKSKVKEMLSILKDVEGAGMDVGWLRVMINECAEALELVSQHRAFEEAKANCDRDIESTRKELDSQMEVLALKEKEVADAKKQVTETRAHLRELELKSSVLSETVGNMKSKVENLRRKSI